MGIESDMAGTALYLSSSAGAFVTGTVLVVDGGFILKNIPPANKVLAKI